MATFQVQVEGMTGVAIDSTPVSTSELTGFLQDGVLEVTRRVISAFPQDAVHFQRESAEQTSNNSYSIKGDILSVVRESGTNNDWRNCRYIAPSLQSRATDSSSFHYASKFNPAYTLLDNGKINVFPTPGANPDAFKVYYVNNDPKRDSDAANLAYDSEDIRFFPQDRYYLVAIYASIKVLEAVMSNWTQEEEDLELTQATQLQITSLKQQYETALVGPPQQQG